MPLQNSERFTKKNNMGYNLDALGCKQVIISSPKKAGKLFQTRYNQPPRPGDWFSSSLV
jgi:hypothetical protein